jgi:hypothetical protein
MRSAIAGIFFVSAWLCAAQIHETLPRHSSVPPGQDGGERTVLESIVIPPIPHAPFTAMLATESVKYSADGAAMTFVNQRRIARDSQGRLYEERWYLVPKDSKVVSKMNWIQIADPRQHTLYNCSTEKRICELLTFEFSSDLASAKMRRGTSHKLPDDGGEVVWEDLGSRNIAGMDTVGARETTTVSAGIMGNDRPLISVSEFWRSDQLGINLLSMRSSPFSGKQTFTTTELTPAEPDPRLFELPAGYKVSDERKNPPISQ